MNKSHQSRVRLGMEQLESRELLTSVPYGATSQDTAEFMLGDVSVNVVFLESNGAIDEDTENWTPELTQGVKLRVEEALQWWTDAIAKYSDIHYLNFHVDYTYADDPVEISYEPISRDSQDFSIWIEEFFREVDVPPASSFSEEIREFNHNQRVANNTNWSFTIFVVNSANDLNHQFGDGVGTETAFRNAFAFPGGRFIVLPHLRPAGTIAHEIGHMFWAFDEYTTGDSYTSRRGYYATQNTNAYIGNPNRDDPNAREPSIMRSVNLAYDNHLISQATRETLGWRDTDGDGIFDVLDVPHQLSGSAEFDEASRTVRFIGQSSVETLQNQNPSGTGRDMTINRITDLQYRIDGGAWIDLEQYDEYSVAIDAVTSEIPVGTSSVQFRTIDDRIGVTSNTITVSVSDAQMEPSTPILQNPVNPLDVSGDGHVTAIDALRIINAINRGVVEPTESGPPYLDVTGDSVVSSRDVLRIINYINSQSTLNNVEAAVEAAADGAAAEHLDAVTAVLTIPDSVEIAKVETALSATDMILAAYSNSRDGAHSGSDFWNDEEEKSNGRFR